MALRTAPGKLEDPPSSPEDDTGSMRKPFLKRSIFPTLPSTIQFYQKGTKVRKPSRRIRDRLKWCNNPLLPAPLRQCLTTSYFTIVEPTEEWIGYWGRHFRSGDFKEFDLHQKVNHFPGAFHLSRKDTLWLHMKEMQINFPGFDFMPYTFGLPEELEDIRKYLDADPANHVIVKPKASARGLGIAVTRNLDEIPIEGKHLAQKYIPNPMLINGHKFDLRLYVYMTSVEPLRIYLYKDGLIRFASMPYSSAESSVANPYIHLTNYSINKHAENNGVETAQELKWTLADFYQLLEREGRHDVAQIQESILDIIRKTFVACESAVRDAVRHRVKHQSICHELYGLDVLLDDQGRAHLLEINVSPALRAQTPVDKLVKMPLAQDVLNMAGIKLDGEHQGGTLHFERTRFWEPSQEAAKKERHFYNVFKNQGRISGSIFKELTPEDVRMLCDFEDELERRGGFELVYPTADTGEYLKYFDQATYPNLLLQRWQIQQKNNRGPGIRKLAALLEGGILEDPGRMREELL